MILVYPPDLGKSHNFAIFAPWRELFFLAEVNSCRIASAIVIKFIEFADAIRLYTGSKES